MLAVAILGLGLGVTLYMFTVVNAYMLTPLPYNHAERIMHIERTSLLDGFDDREVTQHDFVEWREVQTSFSDLAAFYMGTVNLSGGEMPERFDGAFMTPSGFDVIQVKAHLGRTLAPADAEPGAPPVIVLGYDVWLNRYNGDPSILGETIRANGVPTTVVGVMPPGFSFPLAQEVWLPLQIDLTQFARGAGITLEAFGRLKPGVTLGQARAEFANIAAALGEKYEQNENITTAIKPFQDEYVPPEQRAVIATMFAAVLFVLLIACANVANLIETVREIDRDISVYWVRTLDDWIWLGSSTSRLVSTLFSIFAVIAVVLAAAGIYAVLAYSVSQRTREIGVRRALGAVDGRILNMVLKQGMLQLGIGLGIGMLCAVGFARLLSAMLRGVSPFDPFTLTAVALTLFAVAFVASLLPALRAIRVNPMEALRNE